MSTATLHIKTTTPAARLMLPARLVLFAMAQGFAALALGSWEASIAWWPLGATFGNLATIPLLVWLFRAEGKSYGALFTLDRTRLGLDLPLLTGVLLVGLPLALFPSVWLGIWLFGDPQIPLDLLVRPLPFWAVLLAVSFPLTIIFAELPAYFGYCMPRLAIATGRSGLASGLSAFLLAAQHVTLPLVFDGRFMLWRLLMFLPFALLLGVVLRRRQALLPWLVIVHGLLDAAMLPALFGHAT